MFIGRKVHEKIDLCESLKFNALVNNCKCILYELCDFYSFQTYASNVLIAINPFDRSITNPKLYGPEKITQFIGNSYAELPPHIYSIGDGFFVF